MHRTLAAIAALVVVTITAACGDKSEGDSSPLDGDDACPQCDPAEISAVDWDCDTEYSWIEVRTTSWTGGGKLETADPTLTTEGWEETHLVPSIDYDPEGTWDRLYLKLPIVENEADQQPNASTLFPCDPAHTEATMTWAVTIYSYSTGERLQCVTWGADPSRFSDCTASPE